MKENLRMQKIMRLTHILSHPRILEIMSHFRRLAFLSTKMVFPVKRENALCLITLIYHDLWQEAKEAFNSFKKKEIEGWCGCNNLVKVDRYEWRCTNSVCNRRFFPEDNPRYIMGQRVLDIVKSNEVEKTFYKEAS